MARAPDGGTHPDRFLPPDVDPDRVVARLGLLSDTHLPERLADLPPEVFGILAGVDLLLHAGDVGELAVLDRLGSIAPVLAVHGNDDTPEAQKELPLQQLVAVDGRRVLLVHGHSPNRRQELARRRQDAWAPKLRRHADRARRAGASVVVSGHTHVPMVRVEDGVLLVNPGAIAPPNAYSRQRVRTVALLYLLRDALPAVAHVDLAAPDRPFAPRIDWGAEFGAAHAAAVDSILSPDLAAIWGRLVAIVEAEEMAATEREACRQALLRAARRCWAGETKAVTPHDLWAELEVDPAVSPETRERLRLGLTG